MPDWSINPVSEDSVLVTWTVTESAGPALSARIATLTRYLLERHTEAIINVTPAYQSLLIHYDLLVCNADEVTELVSQCLMTPAEDAIDNAKRVVHRIPVFYDPSVAADLTDLCRNKNLSVAELVDAHTSQVYAVYAVGFLPGFAYLGYVPDILRCPRHVSFRGKVPAGSVGIADQQTAIYPSESPGGWQIIGRTPKPLVRQQESVLQVGDSVQFVAIDQSQYRAMGGE